MKQLRNLKANNFAFALPTLVITATILMITAVSVAQTTVSVSQTVRSQSWQHIADEAARAGVTYAYSCLQKNGTDYWTNNLKPNTNCAGSSATGSAYIKDQAATANSSRYRSSFTVSVPDDDKRANAEGRVELVSASGEVTKTWVSNKIVVVNVGEPAKALKLVKTDVHTCVLASDQQVYCAGDNQYGELGNGNTANQSTPVKFNLPSGLTALDVAVGGSGACDSSTCTDAHPHSCVLASSKQVYCAGYNVVGQLGDGTTTNRSTPVKFNLPSGVSATGGLSIGAHNYYTHTCVIANAQIYCAGANYRGEIGVGSTSPTSYPTPARFGTPSTSYWVRDVFTSGDNGTGNGSTCAYIYTGQIYCAGWNGSGQFGRGGSAGSVPTPSLSFSGGSVMDFSLSPDTACALGYQGNVVCAGNDGYGQLGNGDDGGGNKTSPVAFGSVQAKKVVASSHITCALTYNDGASCAGYDIDGQFGDGGSSSYRHSPVGFGIPNGYWVKDIAVSELAVCIVGTTTRRDLSYDNQVFCAGRNSYGGFGNGSTGNATTAVKFNLPAGLYAQDVYMDNAQFRSYYHICVLASDNQAYCSGRNNKGQLGDGTTTNRSTPVKFQLPS